jgi:hypothetical protein
LSERDPSIQLELPSSDRGCVDKGRTRSRATGESYAGVRNSEAWMIEDVVSVNPELQSNTFP